MVVSHLPRLRNGCALCIALLVLSNARSADQEVGAGKAFATISAALSAAATGDRVVVFSGTYVEAIAWSTAVDIVEAPGATAVLKATDSLAGPFLVDIIQADPVTVTWDGIDVVNDSTKFTRFFMARAGNSGATAVIRNTAVTDTPVAEGFGRVITAETGKLTLENVFVNMNSTTGANPGYEIAVGAFGADVEINATNCVFATPGGTVVRGENPTSILTLNGCVLNRKPGPNGFLADLGDGIFTFNDCYFTAAGSTIRGILTRGGTAPTVVELNRCRFDPNVGWRAIQTEKATEMTCTNCCFPTSANEGFFMLHNSAHLAAGDVSEFTFTHCTFSTTQTGNYSGIRDEAVAGATVTYNVDNCLFYIPGSDAAHGAIHGNTQGGTVLVNAGVNYVFSDTDPPSGGLLTGTIDPAQPADPKLSTVDYCHIIDPTSAAIDLASSLGVTDDLDRDARGANPDYGCDEFNAAAPPAPQAPVRVVAVPGNGSAKVTWNPPSGGALAAGYNVYRVSPAPVTKLNDAPVTSLDLVLTPLQNGTQYCFTVRSVGIRGLEGADSAQACATPSGGGGVRDLEVGPDKEFTTIQAAINAARPDGLDRVLVFTGDYDEQLVISKQVDIVEAPGEDAVLRSDTPLPSLSFVVEYVGLGNYTVNWDGIDCQYNLDGGPRRFFLARFNNAGTVINIKNMSIKDTENSGGPDMRFFSNELSGVMNLENVVVDLLADTPDYTMIMSTHVGNATITAKNCKFRGKIGGRFLYSEGSRNVKLFADNCEFDNLGRGAGGAIGQFSDGTVTLNDCLLKGDKASVGLLASGGGSRQVLRVNRCTWDLNPNWVPVRFDKNVDAVFANCCFANNPNDAETPIPHTFLITENLDQFGGALAKLSLLHCTVAKTGENPDNTVISTLLGEGNSMELTVQNCLFSLPGSTVGAVRKDPAALGTLDVIAGKNLRFVAPSAAVTDDQLESDPAGVIVSGDPGLTADFCHIDPPSAALNAGSNVGVSDDIDSETRPGAANVDLGADEFSGTPSPPCGVKDLVCNVGEAISISWAVDQTPPECRCTSIEIRNDATGAVLLTLPGNATTAQILCANVAESGILAVVCKGADGTEKKSTCNYSCPRPIPPCGIANLTCTATGGGIDLAWGVTIDPAECQCAQIEIRNSVNGALLRSLPGSARSASITCAELPDVVGSVNVICIGPNGEDKRASCDYNCDAGVRFHRADADDNGALQLTDAIRILGVLFLGTGVIPCLDAADADDNGALQLTDAVRILGVLFLGTGDIPFPGPPPAACGVDSGSELGCVSYTQANCQ